MFERVFSRAAPLWRAASTLGDIMLVNALLLLTALPIVTFGAGLTAAYDTARHAHGEMDDGIARVFWRSFRTNFARSTALWAVLGTFGVGVAALWVLLPAAELAVMKTLITMLYLLVFPFVWALEARFENTAFRTLRNATLIAVGRLPIAAGVLAIHVVLASIFIATWIMMPQALALLILMGYPLTIWASTPLLERAIAPLRGTLPHT